MRREAEALRFGVLGLLVHDLQDHLTGGGAALGGRVDTDGLLGGTCVLLPVHIYPEDHRDGTAGQSALGEAGLYTHTHTHTGGMAGQSALGEAGLFSHTHTRRQPLLNQSHRSSSTWNKANQRKNGGGQGQVTSLLLWVLS